MGNGPRFRADGQLAPGLVGIVGVNPLALAMVDALRKRAEPPLTRQKMFDLLVATYLNVHPDGIGAVSLQAQRAISDFKIAARALEPRADE